jgi:hypothetical protein
MNSGSAPGANPAMSTRWLSYRELAAALGIKTGSARQLVKRHRWPRQLGNDGHTRIAVPEDVFASRSEPRVEPRNEPEVEPKADPTVHEPKVTVPTRHLEWLQREIELLRERLAAQEGLPLQIAALNATLTELRAERDRWHIAATARRGWWPFRRRA